MNWLTELPSSQPIAWAVIALMLVAVAGLALAQIKIKGIGLGVTGVLFAGIVAGHFGIHIDGTILEFARDFGLILFVFTIVLLGAGVTIGAAYLLKINPFASLGLFSGATTNTPSLGATQQMLKTLGGRFAEQSGLPPLAYAAAYPGAVAGIISVILFLKFAFRDEIEIVQTGQKEPDNQAG